MPKQKGAIVVKHWTIIGTEDRWLLYDENERLVAIIKGQGPSTVADIKVMRVIGAAKGLLSIAKLNHGYDDPLHRHAMPDCWQCKIIDRAEGKA